MPERKTIKSLALGNSPVSSGNGTEAMHLVHTCPASGTQCASNIFLLLCWFCTKQPAYPANQLLPCGNCILSPLLVLEPLHTAFPRQTNVLLFPLDVYICRRKLETQSYCHTILGPLYLFLPQIYSHLLLATASSILQMFSGCKKEVLKFPMSKFQFLRGHT